MDVLFILKRREDYNAQLHSHIGLSTGLYNSASYVSNVLNQNGIDSKIEVVIDNNCIDLVLFFNVRLHTTIEHPFIPEIKFFRDGDRRAQDKGSVIGLQK